MRNLAEVRRVLDASLSGFAERSVDEVAGTLYMRRTLYLDLPHLLRRRLLALVIRWMSGARHPPRSEALFELSMALLIAAPCAGFGAATATCAPSFHQFLLSH
jgi:hypothetical protein